MDDLKVGDLVTHRRDYVTWLKAGYQARHEKHWLVIAEVRGE